MSFTDEWSTPANASQDQNPTTDSRSPSKRASRHNRISNEIEHFAYTRRTTGGDTTDYRVGDAVIVDDTVKLKQKFLHPPLYQIEAQTNSKSRGKGKKKVEAVPADDYEGWKHEDGLTAGEKVAVITRLFEDVRGVKMALVRWFARPGAVWGPEGPQDDEVGCKTLPYELYYTADSSHLTEQRQIEEKRRLHSSPAKSPSKSSSTFISSVASLKTPLHSDPVPLSSITRLVEIMSPLEPSTGENQGTENGNGNANGQSEKEQEEEEIQARREMQNSCPTFIVKKVYDVKPISGASFWSDLQDSVGGWERLRIRGIQGWQKEEKDKATGRNGGGVEEKTKGWDVEPEMEIDSEEDEVIVIRKKAEKKKKDKQEAKTKTSRSTDAKDRPAENQESESEDSEEDEGENFRPDRRAGSSSDEEDGEDSSSEDEDDASSEEDDEEYVRRPRRSPSKRTTSTSPNKKRAQAAPKSSSRPVKRRRVIRSKDTSSSNHNPLPPLLSSAYLASLPTPLERAKALLHVSATPESLPCREEQRSLIRQFVEDAVLSRSGGCLYVHGVPGTGKTATVHSVVRDLQNDPDMDSFTFVEINGMKISEPNAAFSHLWNALNDHTHSSGGTKGGKISPKAALSALEGWFANPDPARKTTVVLVDELDQMLTKRQEVLYNFFNWPHSAHSRLVVIAVANTMDLPERELNGKIRSRLGTNRIAFQPYNWTELKKILEARLALVTATDDSSKTVRLFEDTALQKIAKSVAGISGDARKALDVARRTLDKVALRNQAGDVRCTIQDATAAYNEMTRTGPGFFVKRLSFHEKVLMLALAQCIRRAGVPEVELDSVISWHDTFLRQTHLLPSSTSYPSKSDLMTLIAQLHAMRLVATESQRLDIFQKIRAGVEEGDVFAALREDELLKNHIPQA
ncbi:origin recognition complex subunit 1 [Sporobolomyces salmoneus]|uniref:origin recognition complex subunit 1 n=1 Tax=Sporobolomyces salmoneus TaxID=183962 RepID=UPI00316CF3DF